MIGYWLWLWHKGGSSGGDSFCKGGSSNSLRRSVVSACMCGEGGGDSEGVGHGGCNGSGAGRGQEKNHHNHNKHHYHYQHNKYQH